MSLLGFGVLYVLICLLIGILGRKKKMGFWGLFFASFGLTPIIGLFLLLITGKRKA